MSESSHLRITESSEKGNDIIHEILIIDDRILTLLYQMSNEIAEVGSELFPLLTGHDERILTTFLKRERDRRERENCK